MTEPGKVFVSITELCLWLSSCIREDSLRSQISLVLITLPHQYLIYLSPMVILHPDLRTRLAGDKAAIHKYSFNGAQVFIL